MHSEPPPPPPPPPPRGLISWPKVLCSTKSLLKCGLGAGGYSGICVLAFIKSIQLHVIPHIHCLPSNMTCTWCRCHPTAWWTKGVGSHFNFATSDSTIIGAIFSACKSKDGIRHLSQPTVFPPRSIFVLGCTGCTRSTRSMKITSRRPAPSLKR